MHHSAFNYLRLSRKSTRNRQRGCAVLPMSVCSLFHVNPIYFLAFIFSVLPGLYTHKVGSPPSSPLRLVPFIFILRRLGPCFPLVDWHQIDMVHGQSVLLYSCSVHEQHQDSNSKSFFPIAGVRSQRGQRTHNVGLQIAKALTVKGVGELAQGRDRFFSARFFDYGGMNC